MTRFILIRHGEADYSVCDARGYIGHGRDLAPLTDEGIKQIKRTATDDRLNDADLIVASPYTRALQSAAIISKETGLDISVEIDLHEWIPDTTFQYGSHKISRANFIDFNVNEGKHPTDGKRKWEELETLRSRVTRVIEKYSCYKKVIVVCHGMVIKSLNHVETLNNGDIVEFTYPPAIAPELQTFKPF